MKRIAALLTAVLLIALCCARPASAQGFTYTASGSAGISAPIACDQTASISLSATGQIIALAANQAVYVCGIFGTLTGTTPTVQFEYGTGTTCATGTHVLDGAMLPTAGSTLSLGDGLGTILRAPTGNALCAVLGGTSPSLQGWVLFAQF